MKTFILALLLTCNSAFADSPKFVPFKEAHSYLDAEATCEKMSGRLASTRELREAISEESLTPQGEQSFWTIPDSYTSLNILAALMTAGMQGTNFDSRQRGVVDVNARGMAMARVIYKCTEAMEDGEKACAALAEEFEGNKPFYCYLGGRNPASAKAAKAKSKAKKK